MKKIFFCLPKSENMNLLRFKSGRGSVKSWVRKIDGHSTCELQNVQKLVFVCTCLVSIKTVKNMNDEKLEKKPYFCMQHYLEG